MSGKHEEREPDLSDRLEWAVGGLSALVVAALVGFLVHEGLTSSRRPPELVVTGEAAQEGTLRFVVRNRGGTAASAVVVSAMLPGASGAAGAKRSVTIDYVPPGSQATGGFALPADAQVFVEGYVDP